MEKISVGEKTWIILDEDQIYIRLKKVELNKIYLFLFALANVLIFSILFNFHVNGYVLFLLLILSIYVLIKLLFLFELQEFHFDPSTQELRHYFIVSTKNVRIKVLFPGNHKLHFAWMKGRLQIDENEYIEGYELVAYINPRYHKDLVFFKTKSSKEDLTAVFKELLSIDIEDRMNDQHSRLVISK